MIPVPEEIKGLLRDLIAEQVKLQATVAELDADVKRVTVSNKRLREAQRRSVVERAAIVVVLLASIVLASLYVFDALQRRQDFRDQLRDLACLAVKRSPEGLSETVDDLRRRYGCPPYQAEPSSTPAVRTRTRTATATKTAHPTATATVVVHGTATVTAPAGRVTHTVYEPGRVHTVTRTVTATATVTASCRIPVLCLQQHR